MAAVWFSHGFLLFFFLQALTSSGFLLATDEKGDEYELHPDGNR